MLRYFILTILTVLLFLHGFFPITYNNIEYNNEPPTNINNNYTFNVDQIYSSNVKNSIIIVVDALRLDFVQPKFMPLLAQIANKHGCFNDITVESPTVTLPRIKAITTGSVPQFIDIVTNLASAQVLNDSLVHSAKKGQKNVVFYGDDIWLKLFPTGFLRAEGTTSFFVKDFTDVDNNVTRNVDLELHKTDWDIMILHYLGLDHIGHVLGPFSPLIATKLKEMDDIIYKIYRTMAERNEKTLLVVTGDHGMRDSGGHGGSTYPEKHVPLILIGATCNNNSFIQTDIPVNLAVLLGLNIPSTSIGQLKSSLLTSFNLDKYLYVLRYNLVLLNQKKTLCTEEFNLATEFHFNYVRTNDSESGEKAKELYEKCSEKISSNLFSTSVKQNISSLVIAVVAMANLLLILLKNLTFWTSINTFINVIEFILLLAVVIIQFFITNDTISLFLLLILGSILIKNSLSLKKLKFKATNTTSAILILLSVAHPLTFMSSSFEEEEHQFWYFCINFFVFINIINFSKTNFKAVSLLVLLSIGIRFLRSINQTGDKWATWPDLSDWLLQKNNYIYLQMFFVLGLISIGYCTYFLLPHKSINMLLLSFVVLCCIFVFKNTDYKNVFLGRLIWLLIFLQSILFCRGNFVIPWILVATLLLKSYNLLLVSYCVFASQIFHTLFRSVDVLTLAHLWLGNAMYFAQGHSNSLASVDISVGYIGLESYEPLLVITQVLCHTYAFPVLCNILLFSRRDLDTQKAWTILFCNRLFVIMITCIVTLIHRHHLFIWSVFAPKLFIESSHTIFMLIQVFLYCIRCSFSNTKSCNIFVK